jgi:hypothetical protein
MEMPNMTYPNQRSICVHRERATTDFLGIKNENWKAAARDLSAHAFKLYIYLASNANNYTLALSPVAVRQEIGMARSTFHDQFHVLLDKGYLVPSHGNTYDFYEVPQSAAAHKRSVTENGLSFENGTSDVQDSPQAAQTVLTEDIEINNTQIRTNNLINNGESVLNERPPAESPEEGEKSDDWEPIIPKKESFVF